MRQWLVSENSCKEQKKIKETVMDKSLTTYSCSFKGIVHTKIKITSWTQFIDFHSLINFYYGSQWGPSTVWLPTFFKIYYFVCVREKEIHTVLEELEGE